MAQQQYGSNSTTTGNQQQQHGRNRFTVSQFSDQSRQSYDQYQQEFQKLEQMVTGNIRDEYYKDMILSRLEEASLWITKAIADTSRQ